MRIRTAISLSSTLLKVTALVIAYFLWSMLSDLYVMKATYTVPVNIYTHGTLVVQEKPDHVLVTLRGLRKDLRSLDSHALAVHLDEKNLNVGSNMVELKREHLGLPSCVSLVDYNPINFTVVTAPCQPSAATQPVKSADHATPSSPTPA